MAEMLSASEMESLLLTGERSTGAAGVQRTDALSIRPEVIRAVQRLHEGFAGELATSLSGLFRLPVEVKLVSVDCLSWGELAAALENPTCLYLIRSASPEGSASLVGSGAREGTWLLELSQAFAQSAVDRLLGGDGAISPSATRKPLTEIDWRVLSRVIDRVAAVLRSAWNEVGEWNPKVCQTGSHPQSLSFIDPESELALVSFDVHMDGTIGILNLGLPASALAPFEGRLTAAFPEPQRETALRPSPNAAAAIPKGVELVVRLASTCLTVDEVANLAVGDVIVTTCQHGEPLTVSIDGDPRFAGFAGVVKGRKAVRIDASLLTADERQCHLPGQSSAAARCGPSLAAETGPRDESVMGD